MVLHGDLEITIKLSKRVRLPFKIEQSDKVRCRFFLQHAWNFVRWKKLDRPLSLSPEFFPVVVDDLKLS